MSYERGKYMSILGNIIGEAVSSTVSTAVNTAVNGAINNAIIVSREQKLAEIRNQPKPQVILPSCPNCLAANPDALQVCPYCDSLLVRLAEDPNLSMSAQ